MYIANLVGFVNDYVISLASYVAVLWLKLVPCKHYFDNREQHVLYGWYLVRMFQSGLASRLVCVLRFVLGLGCYSIMFSISLHMFILLRLVHYDVGLNC